MAGCRARKRCEFGVGFVAFLLVTFTALLLYIGRSRVDAFAWAMLGFCGLVLGLMVGVNRSIVHYNLNGTPIELGGVLIAMPIAVVVLIVIYVAARREPALPVQANAAEDLLAEETHSAGARDSVDFAGPCSSRDCSCAGALDRPSACRWRWWR